MSTRRSFGASIGSKAIGTFAARIAVAVTGVLTGILIARLLGPQGKGTYSGVQTLLSIPVAVTGGAGAAITYLMTKGRRTIGDLFPTLAAAFVAAVLLTAAAGIAYAAVHAWQIATVAFLVAMPPAILLSWQQAYYIGSDRIRRLNAQNVAVALCTLAGTLLLCRVLRFGVTGALCAWIATLYGCAAIVLADMLRGGGALHLRGLWEHSREFLRIGSQSAVNTLLGALNYRIDSLLIIAILGLPVFGVYSIAVSVGELLFLIARSINTAIGREVGIATLDRASQITAMVVRGSVLTCALCALPIALFAPPLIHAVYGPLFDGAALPLRLLLPGIVAFATSGTFASYFIFQLGRPSSVTIINVVMIAFQCLACLALVPRFGTAGAAIASTIAYAGGALVSTILFCRASGIPASTLWIPRRSDVLRVREIARELLASATFRHRLSGHVVLTGAAGNVSGMIREGLRGRYHMLLTDCRRIGRVHEGETFVRADLRNITKLRRIMRGARAVIHLGGISNEAAFESVLQANIRGTYAVLEAARLEGVRRVILASSGHVTGLYPRHVRIDETAAPRPDSFYGVSKACTELLGRFFAEKFGMQVVCLRIGHVSPEPQYEIDRSIWLSPRDLLQLLGIAIETPEITFETLYAVSDNPERFWSLERARSMGYAPKDAAQVRARILNGELTGVAALFQGETFAARDLVRNE
jgi:uronate dehydrogenase